MVEINKKIAVIGSAHPHVLQIASLARQAGFEIVGLYDEDQERCAVSAESLGTPAFADIDSLLSPKPGVALVGAVPNLRAELAARCAHAGVDALVDKPLALNLEDLADLKAVVARTGRRILVYYPYRGHPYLRAAKTAITGQRIGDLVCVETTGPHCLGVHDRPDWHWRRACNGDILLDIAAHGFDICHWFAQADVVDVNARMGNFASPAHPEFRDFGHATLRFRNGVIGKIESDWLVPSGAAGVVETRFSFQGTRGRIDLRIGGTCSGTIRSAAGLETLTPEPGSMDSWTIDLLHAMCAGKPCDISQDSGWRASESALQASAAARLEESLLQYNAPKGKS